MTKKTPQVENGYVRIASELLDALAKTRIPSEARRCLDFIIRKTYGFGKKKDKISLSQFEKGTEMSRQNVARALKKLEEMNVVLKDDTTTPITYGVQKDYKKWKAYSPLSTGYSKPLKGVLKDDKRGYSGESHTIDIITIDNTIDKEGVLKTESPPASKRFSDFYDPETKEGIKNRVKLKEYVETIWYWGEVPKAWVQNELKKMQGWLVANPDKGKTKWHRFACNWLGRSYKQDIESTALRTPITSAEEDAHYRKHRIDANARGESGFTKVGDIDGD